MGMKRAVWMAVVYLALGTGLAWAQGNGRIEGRVSRQDGTPLGGVSVRIDGLIFLRISDINAFLASHTSTNE